MEDVLAVYTRPFDPLRPQVCMDEISKQLIGETRLPLPAAPGQPARCDYEYVRNGVANLFMFFEPLAGRREVKVTERRTMLDWAEATRELVDVHYPDAEQIVLVLDNLNTHGVGSLYEAFPPAEAARIARRLEIHYTPKHGSWLGYPLGDGRERAVDPGPPVPQPPPPRCGNPATAGPGLAARTQRGGDTDALALYHRRGANSPGSAVPIGRGVTDH